MANRTGYPECSHEVCIQAAGDRGGGPIICVCGKKGASPKPRCIRCRLSGPLESDGLCSICSHIEADADEDDGCCAHGVHEDNHHGCTECAMERAEAMADLRREGS